MAPPLASAALVESPAPSDAPVAVEELHDRGAISALAGEWERLARDVAAAGGAKGPFLAPEWLSIYAASLCNPRGEGVDERRRAAGKFRLLVAHRGGRLVGALPLVLEKRSLAGAPARVLRSLSDDHSQRFDVLLAPGDDGDAAARALVAHLGRARDWDAVELQTVPRQGDGGVRLAGASRLAEAARAAGMQTGTWASMVSPYLPLPPTDAELDKQLGSKFRGNVRRRAKKLVAERGPLTLERLDPAAMDARALDAALDEGFALEAAGWKGELGTAIACDPVLRARYRALAHAFAAKGQLACYFLKAGPTRIAFHFALDDGETYYLFKPGFDPSLASFGPGHLMVDAVCRDLIARGVRELDFLGDDMTWKRDWTDRARAHDFVYLFAPTLRGRMLGRWKLELWPAVKEKLGRAQSTVERLRNRFPRLAATSPTKKAVGDDSAAPSPTKKVVGEDVTNRAHDK